MEFTKDVELNIEKVLELLPFADKIPATEQDTFTRDLLVYVSEKYEILPELMLVFPLKDILKLIYIFSDKTIKIPDKKAFENAMRDLSIFYAVKENPEHKTVKALAEKYDLTLQATLWIVSKVSAKLEVDNPLKS